MKPTVDFVLQASGQMLHGDVMPAVTGSTLQGSTYVIGALMSFAALDYERGADVRMTDNNEMRAIFMEASEKVTDASLAERLRLATSIKENSLRMSELDRVNDLLKDQFIELHRHVENCKDSWVYEFEGHLLKHLDASLSRRALPGA